MNRIIFDNFVITNGYITFQYRDHIDSGVLYFELSHKIIPENDLIAIALSTLCGRGNYDAVHFDLDLQKQTLEKIQHFCLGEITSKSVLENHTSNEVKKACALSFSGGFDSLSAKYLMPDDTVLVSMDFGGKFAREREFFEKFNTHIVKTNLLETHLKKNSWSFMGISAILFSNYLNIKYHTFGGILESSPNNFVKNNSAAKNITFPPFLAASMENAPYTLGITEIGTAMILLKNAPELVKESLDSLANNGETKKYRKQLITSLVAKLMNVELDIGEFDTPNHKLTFGKNFTDDFLSFYFLKYAGMEAVSKFMVGIPEEAVQLSQKLSLKFFERLNTNFTENFPAELLPNLLQKASDAKVIPYTKSDWLELDQIVALLSKYYKF